MARFKSKVSSLVKSLPDIDLNISVTAGVQAGVQVGNAVQADLNLVNWELLNDNASLKDGKLESNKQLGFYELKNDQDTPQEGKVKMKNSASIKVLGFGAGIEQEQMLDSDWEAHDRTVRTRTSSAFKSFGSSVIQETKGGSNETTTKQETGFTLGLKFIIGVELKFRMTQGGD